MIYLDRFLYTKGKGVYCDPVYWVETLLGHNAVNSAQDFHS